MIAELLGHNSTVAARAYVTATPNIARIKEKALGKSPAYQRIMRSLLTGEVVRRRDTAAEMRSVLRDTDPPLAPSFSRKPSYRSRLRDF